MSLGRPPRRPGRSWSCLCDVIRHQPTSSISNVPPGRSASGIGRVSPLVGVSSGTLIWSAACQWRRGWLPRCLRVGCRRGERIGCCRRCVATQMRGLVPHDRVCEMRSGADLWRRAWPPMGLLTAFSRIAPRVVAPVRSPRRAVAGGGYSIVASAQQCAASSRATATTTIVRGLPRPSSACQRP